jgi:hypothetical protein
MRFHDAESFYNRDPKNNKGIRDLQKFPGKGRAFPGSPEDSDWQYEDEVRVFARLEERDPASGFYFGEFNEQLVLREVIVGPLSKVTKREIQDALHDDDITITKGRLAFRTFDVVCNRRGFIK